MPCCSGPCRFPSPNRLVVFMNTSPRAGRSSGITGEVSTLPRTVRRRPGRRRVPVRASSTTPAATCRSSCDPAQVSWEFFRCSARPLPSDGRSAPTRIFPTARRSSCSARGSGRRRFNSDPNVVGRPISLGGDTYTIVGVLGDFHFEDFGPPPQVWVPFQLDPYTKDQGHYFQAAGRLKPGVTLDQAQVEAEVLRRRSIGESFRTRWDRTPTFSALPIRDSARAQRQNAAARDRRRGQLRAADRVRERRESAAGSCDRAAARDRHSRRDRGIARAHHPSAADRKRRAVRCGRHRSACCSA